MKNIRTAVIGVGYLGAFHAQKYAILEDSVLVCVVDTDFERAQQVAAELSTKAFRDFRDLLGQVDAVSIAVPTVHHHLVAKECLEAGVHILLEKPVTRTVEEAENLIQIAHDHNLVFQTGHLERFNPAVLAMREIVQNPVFVESERMAPFRGRGTDVSVVLDLMIHDIDIILSIVDSDVRSLQSMGGSVLTDETDIAHTYINFGNDCVANITASRVSREAVRKIRFFQRDAYITTDYSERSISVFRKGGAGQEVPGLPGIRMDYKTFEEGDALLEEIRSFLMSVREGTPPVVSGQDGLNALKIASRITSSFTSAGFTGKNPFSGQGPLKSTVSIEENS